MFRVRIVLIALVLVACSKVPPTVSPSPTVTARPSITAVPTLTATATSTARPTETPTATSTETATPSPTIPAPAAAVAVVHEFCEALLDNDDQRAAALFSDYSLEIIRQELYGSFNDPQYLTQFYGILTTRCVVIDSRLLDDETPLVLVEIHESGIAQDQWLALRMENGVWRINYGEVIEQKVLDIEPQTINGVTVELLSLTRTIDGIEIAVHVSNSTSSWVHWGSDRKPKATLIFGSDEYNITDLAPTNFEPFENNTIFIITAMAPSTVQPFVTLDPSRLFPVEVTNPTVILDGLYATNPTEVYLINWEWGRDHTPQPDQIDALWIYHFMLQ